MGKLKEVDTTPAIDGTSGNLEVEAIEDNDGDQHGVDGLINKINGKCNLFYFEITVHRTQMYLISTTSN